MDNQIELDESNFEQFDYRLIYMRTNAHSDERLAVGLAAASAAGLEIRMISSVPALNLLTSIIGEAGVEQFQFAASELRQTARTTEVLSKLKLPTNLLIAGDSISAITRDRSGLLASVLASASTLVRTSSARAREVVPTSPNKRVSRDLYEQVSILNPLKADDLFHQKVSFDSEKGLEEVELPILGNVVFGAPVSFAGATSDQKMRAEAYVAKFNWVKNHIPQRPKIYILTPGNSISATSRRAEDNIRELQAVARASEVAIDVSDSMLELASILIKDEAA